MNLQVYLSHVSDYFSPELIGEVNDVYVKVAKIKGDIYIIKRGINHRVSSTDECQIMLIENKVTAHTGDIVS